CPQQAEGSSDALEWSPELARVVAVSAGPARQGKDPATDSTGLPPADKILSIEIVEEQQNQRRRSPHSASGWLFQHLQKMRSAEDGDAAGPPAFAAASIDFDTAPKVDYNPFTTGGPAVSAAHQEKQDPLLARNRSSGSSMTIVMNTTWLAPPISRAYQGKGTATRRH
ncbi:MAG: hypothetical protein M8467_16165, partial [Anaerolineae bacterium]|nr:hypothetical protein [Anaerolineae bacterium]